MDHISGVRRSRWEVEAAGFQIRHMYVLLLLCPWDVCHDGSLRGRFLMLFSVTVCDQLAAANVGVVFLTKGATAADSVVISRSTSVT